MHRGFRQQRVQARSWLRSHPRLHAWLKRHGALSLRDGGLRRGVAIGLFIGLTPTVGIQTVLMLLACVFWRASFPVAFALSWVSNPLTMGPLYLGFHFIGELLFEPVILTLVRVEGLAETAALETVLTLLGSLPIAAMVALIGYWLGRDAERLIERRRAPPQK